MPSFPPCLPSSAGHTPRLRSETCGVLAREEVLQPAMIVGSPTKMFCGLGTWCSTVVSWRCWQWVILWTTHLITVDNLKIRRRALFIWTGFNVAEQLIGCFCFLQLWRVCFMATWLLTRGVRGRIIRGIIISTSVGLNPDLWSAKVAHLLGSRGPQEFKDRGLEKMVHLS